MSVEQEEKLYIFKEYWTNFNLLNYFFFKDRNLFSTQ